MSQSRYDASGGTKQSLTSLQADVGDLQSQNAIMAHKFSSDFITADSSQKIWSGSGLNSGTTTGSSGTQAHPGGMLYTSSTTPNSGYRYMTNNGPILIAGGESSEFVFKTRTLTGTLRKMGFHNSFDYNAPADGAYLKYDGATLTGRCVNNGSESTTVSNYTLAVDTWYSGEIKINANATLVTFTLYQDNTYTVLWTDTLVTNIPSSRTLGHGDVCTNSGSSSVPIGHIDYMEFVLPNTRVLSSESLTQIGDNTAKSIINAVNAMSGKYSITIAASNATSADKVNAEYVCTGTNDDVIINAAIQSLPSSGGIIKLSSGLFSISNSIAIDRMVNLEGVGWGMGARASYAPTNGNVFDGTFGSNNQGITTLRLDADIDGIIINTTKKGVNLRKFMLIGYGKDRHTKAGISIIADADSLLIDGVSVTDCNICLYAWTMQLDSPTIANSCFEWCGCGMMLNAGYPRMTNVIFCDNNGLVSYNGTTINCGGLVLKGGGGVFNNINILRSNKYQPNGQVPIHLMYLYHSDHNTFTGLRLDQASGCGIYAENSNCNVVNGCSITNIGSKNVSGQNIGIYADGASEGWVVTGNNIGLQYGTTQLKTTYFMNEAVKLDCDYGTGHIVVGNRSAYSQVATPFVASSPSIVANNLDGQ